MVSDKLVKLKILDWRTPCDCTYIITQRCNDKPDRHCCILFLASYALGNYLAILTSAMLD